jgi:hypothetical protein
LSPILYFISAIAGPTGVHGDTPSLARDLGSVIAYRKTADKA